MKPTNDAQRIADASVSSLSRRILKGQFVEILRSSKGKVKGIVLQTPEQAYEIKLPKYLRPILVRELMPQTFVQVWAYREDEKWRGINIMPLAEGEAIALRSALANRSASTPAIGSPSPEGGQKPQGKQMCVQVCRKGKCFKEGGKQIFQTLQAEAETNPDFSQVTVEAVGCMKACKKGPNMRISGSSKVISGVTPANAVSLVAKYL